MKNNIYLQENLKLCLSYSNMPVQLLASVSLLFFFKGELKNKKNINSEIIQQIENNILDSKNKMGTVTIRNFVIFSHIKSLFYLPNLEIAIDSLISSKELSKDKDNLNDYFLEKFITLAVSSKNSTYLNKKQIEIIELTCEIKKNFLLVDFFGFLKINEELKYYMGEIIDTETQIEKVSFHIFRKLKNFKNVMLVKNSFHDNTRVDYIFQDKLINRDNISEFISFIADGIYCMLLNWQKSLNTNTTYFFLWIKNVFLYQININKILSNFSLFRIERRGYFDIDDNSTDFNNQITSTLKFKKFGIFLKFSVLDPNFHSFIRYGEAISYFYENQGSYRQRVYEIDNKHKSEINYFTLDTFGFRYFQETLIGIIELKKNIFNIADNQVFCGIENKIIFSIGLIGTGCYSERILNFFIRKFRKCDFINFLKTGDYSIYKNFSNLILGISLIFHRVVKNVWAEKLKLLRKFFFEFIGKFFFSKSNKIYLFQRTLKRKQFFQSIYKIIISMLVSVSVMQKYDPKFFYEIAGFLKYVDNNSILNRDHDFLLRFLPVVIGVQVLGAKKDLKISKFKFYLTNKKNLQNICIKMMQYCSFLGSGRKGLIKNAIRQIRLFEILRIRKSERNFIIQEKCKKKYLLPTFSSIYDLNTDRELNRSFIFFKTKVEGSILGLCLLSFGDNIMSKLVYRLHSFFLISEFIEYVSFAILSISFLFLSNNECPAIDFIAKLSGSKDFLIAKNSIFALGLIGAGTNNTRIKNALKCLANFYKLKLENKYFKKKSLSEEDDFQFFRKSKSLLFLIRLSQGMVNSFYCNLSKKEFSSGKPLNSIVAPVLFVIFSFMTSNFIGHESIFACFFLLAISFKSKLYSNLDINLKIRSIKIKNPLINKLTQTYILTPCFLEA